MSSVDTDGEIQDLITCSVCLIEFDKDEHKPKFLPCGHTLCSSCIKVIRKNRAIRCPLCRKVHTVTILATLPNNNYALQIARLSREKKQLESLLQQNETSLLSISENFPALKTQLGEMRAQRQTNLCHAIEMRKEISSHLLLVMDSVKNAEKEVAGQMEENERFLTDLISLYEEGSKLSEESTGEASGVNDVSEVESLVNSCQVMYCPDDTEETIKEKMRQSVEKSREKLKLATCDVTRLRRWKNAAFVLKAHDSDSIPLFNSTIKIDWTTIPFSSKDLNHLLLSHLICYLIQPSRAVNSPDVSSTFVPTSISSFLADTNRFLIEDDDSDFISRIAASHSRVESTESSYEGSSSNLSGMLSLSHSFLRRGLSRRSEGSSFERLFVRRQEYWDRRRSGWFDSSNSD